MTTGVANLPRLDVIIYIAAIAAIPDSGDLLMPMHLRDHRAFAGRMTGALWPV
jgi:hypothetical protein